MIHLLRVLATAAALGIAGIGARAGEAPWLAGDGDEGTPSAILTAGTSRASSALLELLAGLTAPPSAFATAMHEAMQEADASQAADASAPTAQPVAEAAAPAPAAVPLTAVAAAPAPAGHGVLDQLAFEQALQALLVAAPPTQSLAGAWKAIAEVYRQSYNRAIWREGGRWSAAARAAVVQLSRARDDALTLPAIMPATLSEGSPDSLAAQDLALTASVVAYARQAAGERVDPARISRLITARPVVPEARDIVAAVAVAGDHAADVLAAYNPPQPGYRALRAKLAELRAAAAPMASTRIPAGPSLRVGMRDERVRLIRARFGLEIATPASVDDIVYDTRVADAVAGFQRQNGLAPTGVLSPRTVALLSGGQPHRLENEIVANMERWRWLPRDMGRDRIEVDVANFTLALYRDDAPVFRTRVIVGKPETPTPIFSNAMKFIIVNPSWFIPPSILKNEILPKLAADPDYLKRLGYEMTMRRGQVSVRQPPGEKNALGRIKFMFPNDHAVYLHDTPSRHLFASTRRAFSHGCMRVDNPMALAAAILRGPWTESRIKSMVGGGERTLNLGAPLPIHIEYFTASIGADGRLQFRDDLYGYDRAVMRALALAD